MKKQTFFSSNVRSFVAVAIAVVVSASSSLPAIADSFDDKIKQKQAEANQLSARANELNIYGNTLQEAVNNLSAQIANLEAKIAANQQKMQELNANITKAEADIAQRNKALGDNLRMMYHEGEVSNLEKVASSKSISDFVDKQEARNRLQDKVKTALDEIKVLKKQLEAQKIEVDRLIKDDESMRSQVNAQRVEQARLLEQTRGEEAAYQQQVAGKQAEIKKLQAAQAAALSKVVGGGGSSQVGSSIVYKNLSGQSRCGGGYAYCQFGHDEYVNDDWGLHLARECVHYVAWALADRGYYLPSGAFGGGRGNANQWESTLVGKGVAYADNNPEVNAVAYMPIGGVGHVGIVEEVYGNGWVRISQYNFTSPPDGRYSTMDLKVTPNIRFLHLQK